MFKDRLKELRKAQDLSVKSFAESIGMSRPTIANYESGRGKPSQAALEKIAEVYNVSVEWLKGEGVPAVKEVMKEVKEAVEVAAPVVKEESIEAEELSADETTVEEPVESAEEKAVIAEEPVEEETVAEAETPAAEEAVEAEEPAEEEIAVQEEKPVEKKKRGRKKGSKVKNAPELIVESMMGGQISISEILSRIPEGVDAVYVKPEENKAYYTTTDGKSDSVDLW